MADYAQALTWYLVRRPAPRGSMQALAQQVPGFAGARPCAGLAGRALREGRHVRGALVVQSYDEPNRYGPEEQALLEFVASHVLTAVQRKQSQRALERRLCRSAPPSWPRQSGPGGPTRRQRGERLQAALYRIAERANDMGRPWTISTALCMTPWAISSTPATATSPWCRKTGRRWNFPYYVDEQGGKGHQIGAWAGADRIRAAHPQAAAGEGRAEADELIAQVFSRRRAPCHLRLGVPLVCDGRALGVIAVQSYQADVAYSDRDRLLLSFVSHQIASSLVRRRTTDSFNAPTPSWRSAWPSAQASCKSRSPCASASRPSCSTR